MTFTIEWRKGLQARMKVAGTDMDAFKGILIGLLLSVVLVWLPLIILGGMKL